MRYEISNRVLSKILKLLGMPQKFLLKQGQFLKFKTRYYRARFFLNHENGDLFNLTSWKKQPLEFCKQGATKYPKSILTKTVAFFLGKSMT